MIKFNDLSNPLKIGIVLAYAIGIVYALAFLIGFIIGLGGG